jgi:glycosyltransferase involved in cell wall biosynthesis
VSVAPDAGDARLPVTVVIPVWDDYVKFLPDAVESVSRAAGQFPILIVDNASRAPIPDLPGTTVIRAPRRLTVGGARNFGLVRVRTEYVLVLDADDMLLPWAARLLCSKLEQDRSLSMGAMSIFDGGTNGRHRTPRRFAARMTRWPRAFALAHAIWSLVPIQGCALLRTQEARQAGGYADADWADDWVLSVSLAFRGGVHVSERLGRYYRLTAGSISRQPKTSGELAEGARLVRQRIRSDPEIPAWMRAALPLVALLQLAAIYGLRPAYRRLARA